MRIAHLGHSTVMVETARSRILIDPGNYSSAWHDVTDLDAIVVTHAHPDHVDPEWFPVLAATNPQAKILVEPGVLQLVDIPRAERFPAGSSFTIGKTKIEGVGGLHAIIHRDIPRIGNVGIMVRTLGEPQFFHPGDCLDTIPQGVDILAAPAHGPWCAMKEIIDFIRDIKAPQGFLIHDGLINETGWGLSFARFNEMTPTVFSDLRSGQFVSL
ncbi:MAG: MBL fold metallo-hydrolase [Propionibacteriaceae bacterium]|nr:MBL fold metallo-hydrolase [Propionibacteriaceae bacterium]